MFDLITLCSSVINSNIKDVVKQLWFEYYFVLLAYLIEYLNDQRVVITFISTYVTLFQYVIKKLNLTTSSKRERRAAEQEAQLLSQLRHPNIVTYRESWEGDDCQLYIVMGFCEGGDLYHRLKQQKGELLPERQVVEWFVQIAMALQVGYCSIESESTWK